MTFTVYRTITILASNGTSFSSTLKRAASSRSRLEPHLIFAVKRDGRDEWQRSRIPFPCILHHLWYVIEAPPLPLALGDSQNVVTVNLYVRPSAVCSDRNQIPLFDIGHLRLEPQKVMWLMRSFEEASVNQVWSHSVPTRGVNDDDISIHGLDIASMSQHSDWLGRVRCECQGEREGGFPRHGKPRWS